MSHWESSGKSSEWYTPKFIFDALDVCFDLDVAAPSYGPLHVPCLNWLSFDSLARQWEGFIWCNPPYGGRNSIEPWLRKFIDHRNGIAVTPDRTSAPWFQRLAPRADRILFAPKVRFIRPDGSEGKSPSNGTALWGVGSRAVAALDRSGLGFLSVPLMTHSPTDQSSARGGARAKPEATLP